MYCCYHIPSLAFIGVSLAESVPVVVIIFNGILSGNYSDAYLAEAELPHDIAKEFDIKEYQ